MRTLDERIIALNGHVGLNQKIGIEIIEWLDGSGAVQLRVTSDNLNPAKVVHGGVLSSMLDVALAMSGSYFPPPNPLMPGLTLHLSIQFLAGANETDGLLTATARKTGGGTSLFFAEGEVRTESGKIIATATGTFKRGRLPNA